MNFKVATWNICLGLPNKKDIVTDYLKLNNISICCLQETEIQQDFPTEVLNTGGFALELEMNDVKKRSGIYFRSDVKYVRRNDLEIKNYHIVISEVTLTCTVRIMCLYRFFLPSGYRVPSCFL